jgi:outer membrane receptor protein involved in Fe transport
LNEMRVQWAQRHNRRFANADSGTGPAINISGSINFGGPLNDGEDFQQDIYQFVDNFTLMRGDHNYKAGIDYQYVRDHRAVNETATFTFTTVDAYNAALSGASPYGYSTFSQTVGVPTLDFNDSLLSAFVQDDWKVTPDLKVLYGVRYDVYLYPNGVPNATYPLQQSFNIDKNNIAPRVGFAWTMGAEKKTVLRASTGIMYDQPLLAIIEQSYTQSSNPARITVNLNGTGNASGASPGAPPFPSTLSDPPPGYAIPLSSRTIFAMDPNFVTGRTFQNNVQLQRGIGRDYSAAIGFIYSKGYNLPVVLDTNLKPTGTFLADGRNIFSTAVNASTRVDPNYNHINVAQSIGDSTYKGLTLEFSKRWSNNFQYSLNYTLARGIDNAVMTGTLAVQGDDAPSDPLNLERDRGPNALDIRHTFNASVVAMSSWHRGNEFWQHFLSNNQVGLILQFNSGSDFNVRSNTDLNKDGTGNDRPLDVTRNSMFLPPRYNTNLRYSRFFTISGPRRLEFQAEFQNLFNTLQVSGVNRTINVSSTGVPLAPIPATGGDFPYTSAYEQRKFQIGFKFYF